MTIVNSIRHTAETYHKTLDFVAWVESLMETAGGVNVNTHPDNNLEWYFAELYYDELHLSFDLVMEFEDDEQLVCFSVMSGQRTSEERRTLIRMSRLAKYGHQDVHYDICLDTGEESSLRKLLELRENAQCRVLAIEDASVYIDIGDVVRFKSLLQLALQLRGSPQERAFATLQRRRRRE